MATTEERRAADEKRLSELGYKQELERSWTGFQNFAISFTIISILAGCFTTYFQAWNNGGPVAISIGWPLISVPILIIGFCMSELVSAYPTAGGIYWWASKLGGPVWGWFTGWFNLIGLVAVTASVDYGAATFMNTLFGLFKFDLFNGEHAGKTFLHGTFFLFLVILALHATINILGSHLVARVNSISVWWHVAGVAVILVVLVVVPSHHASANFVFTERINNSGFGGHMYWFYVLPLGFLLTQYTITGYDSCAHVSEETQGAADAAAKGVWRSIFYSAVIGYILLLALTFAVSDPKAVTAGGGSSIAVLESAMGTSWVKLVLLISVVGQVFCGAACLTSASRMCYAFSRDGAIPGSSLWSKVNHRRIPVNAVLFMAACGAVLTIPAYFPNSAGLTVAFGAVVSIAVIGLYIAYVIPIYLRWREGDTWEAGPWTNGAKYRWMNPVAVVWVAIVTVIFILPTTPAGTPFRSEFSWSAVNYAPLVTGGVILAVGLWWVLGAKHTFTGPKMTVRELDAEIDV
ncbi:amino acid permease [Paraconexibacter antarcticus]|uniref:Amino acid permease n=1 Tax=Paraconexibacter antarcticus TaxID=2949664 RepID=A0ABY5DX43_9ACTN|nr:amino acid permease [Paraconexibacter antarcticus]UTI66603.1 amino acid permease [Paraconexibacter antarcticus]